MVYNLYTSGHPIVLCGTTCFNEMFRKQKAEAEALVNAEDIGTDDSEWSTDGSDTAGTSTEEFIDDNEQELYKGYKFYPNSKRDCDEKEDGEVEDSD